MEPDSGKKPSAKPSNTSVNRLEHICGIEKVELNFWIITRRRLLTYDQAEKKQNEFIRSWGIVELRVVIKGSVLPAKKLLSSIEYYPPNTIHRVVPSDTLAHQHVDW